MPILLIIFAIIWLIPFILFSPKIKDNAPTGVAILLFFLVTLAFFGSMIQLYPLQHYTAMGGLPTAGMLSFIFFLNVLLVFTVLKLRRKIVTRNDIVVVISGILISQLASIILNKLIVTLSIKFFGSIPPYIFWYLGPVIQLLFWITWFGVRDRLFILLLAVCPFVANLPTPFFFRILMRGLK